MLLEPSAVNRLSLLLLLLLLLSLLLFAREQYYVSSGTSIPEVLFDFWKVVSEMMDEHRATREELSFRRLVMFVAPFCEARCRAPPLPPIRCPPHSSSFLFTTRNALRELKAGFNG